MPSACTRPIDVVAIAAIASPPRAKGDSDTALVGVENRIEPLQALIGKILKSGRSDNEKVAALAKFVSVGDSWEGAERRLGKPDIFAGGTGTTRCVYESGLHVTYVLDKVFEIGYDNDEQFIKLSSVTKSPPPRG